MFGTYFLLNYNDIYANKIREKFLDDSMYDLLLDWAPTITNDTMFNCNFGSVDGCTNLFHRIITDYGVCLTFNTLNSKDIYTTE